MKDQEIHDRMRNRSYRIKFFCDFQKDVTILRKIHQDDTDDLFRYQSFMYQGDNIYFLNTQLGIANHYTRKMIRSELYKVIGDVTVIKIVLQNRGCI